MHYFFIRFFFFFLILVIVATIDLTRMITFFGSISLFCSIYVHVGFGLPSSSWFIFLHNFFFVFVIDLVFFCTSHIHLYPFDRQPRPFAAIRVILHLKI